MSMTVCTIQLWYNKQRIKKNRNVSLYLQIISGKESAEIPLKLEWPVDKFDWDKKALKQRSAEDAEVLTFNAVIERERAKYWNAVLDFIREDQEFTIADLFKRVNTRSVGQMLGEYMRHNILARQRTKDMDDKIKDVTARTHTTTLNCLLEYTKGADVPIAKVNSKWMRSFAGHLRKTLCENSVWTRIKIVKTYLSWAAKNKIHVDQDYKNFKITMDEPEPRWLEEQEVQQLLKLYSDPELHPVSKNYLKAFLFACFTGLRISDLSRWQKSWIHGDVIKFVPAKNRLSSRKAKELTIPIIPIARTFIDQLKGETFDLPAEQMYNRELKSIASNAGIEKRVTSHVARHTFATWLAIDEVPVIVISKLLGHRSVKTTMVYIHIAERYKAVQMMKMQRRFGLGSTKDSISPAK